MGIKISDELQEALDNPPFVIVGAAATLAFVILLLFLTAWDGSHASLWCRTFSERRSPSQYTAHSAQSRNSRVSQISRLSQPVTKFRRGILRSYFASIKSELDFFALCLRYQFFYPYSLIF